MKCPRCSATVPANPDASGFLICPGCGARLRSKSSSGGRASAPPQPARKPADIDAALARLDAPGLNPDVTLPPSPSPAQARPPAPAPSAPAPEAASASFERVLSELAAIRRTQDEILGLLRSRPAAERGGGAASADDSFMGGLPAVAQPRDPKRKNVLVVDDDSRTLSPAVEALQQMGLTVRAVQEGNASLAAIAEQKPDVIVMELAVAGAMGGKDVINMIKATMEWVDIPIILHTRVAVENQKEARTVHGADDLVLKSPDSAQTLATRVAGLLRK
ncbi:MAG TPA: response regulator [Vicinamibacteria bacterium]|jgi:CheY-like chemotaxis protein|nr:response regulator [Vicinamibacteria bacterium]